MVKKLRSDIQPLSRTWSPLFNLDKLLNGFEKKKNIVKSQEFPWNSKQGASLVNFSVRFLPCLV